MPCSVCGNSLNNSEYVVSEMMFGFKDKFDYFECSKCGCLQIASMPEDMEKYYPSEYYSFSENKASQSKARQFLRNQFIVYALTGKSRLIGGTVNWVMPSRKEWLQREGLLKLRLTKHSRILDVGCGSGTLLFNLVKAGFSNVSGIDAFIESDIVYNGKKMIRKTVLEEVDGEYDLITFHHSFEHMYNQLEGLQAVKRLLATKGTCVISMPTVSSYAWEQYRENWVQLDAPRHCFIHSQDSIRMLAGKAGFEITDVTYNSWSFQFWGSIQYQKGIPLRSEISYSENPSKSMFSNLQISEFEKKAKELNRISRGDEAVFHLISAS